MRQSFTISTQKDDLLLQTVESSDCENLRQWKNANRFSFFFQKIITPQMQEEWFIEYSKRINDYMFVVQYCGVSIGCMGFRLVDGYADVYNVILGNLEYGRKGLMGKALSIMCSYIFLHHTQNIGLDVLRTNPALNWYLKNGFYEDLQQDTFFKLRLSTEKFRPIDILITLN